MENGHKKYRVCIIGAGPSGMCALYQHHLLDTEGRADVVCYEKQATWGGQWNLTWMTGTDEFGELLHNGQYYNLWHNGPKEGMEFDDFSFEECYGKLLPSYVPREIIRGYMEGRLTKKANTDLKKLVKFNHAVKLVRYDENTDEFTVTVTDLKNTTVYEETFTHIFVAAGIFGAPYKPYYPGMETFPGRVMHSKDFRQASDFKDQRVLTIGDNYSAEDISVMCIKYGAKSVVNAYKIRWGLIWPPGITERPEVTSVAGSTVTFKDGSTADFDAIIICAGYLVTFPFMEDSLRLTEKKSFYPDNLYKGVLWMKGGNDKVFYIGVQNQIYTFPMFDGQTTWAWRFILNKLADPPQSRDAMLDDIRKWLKKLAAMPRELHAIVAFLADYNEDLVEVTSKNKNLFQYRQLFHEWIDARNESFVTCRDTYGTHGMAAVETMYRSENFATWRDKRIASSLTGNVDSPLKNKMHMSENFATWRDKRVASSLTGNVGCPLRKPWMQMLSDDVDQLCGE